MTAETVEATNKELLRKRFAAWGDGTGSPYDLLADDAVWTIVGQSAASRTYHGREDFLANVIRPFGSRMASHFIGFKEYGLERRALKVGSEYYDEVLMSLPLTPRPEPVP
jgi:hypothetical protein